MHRPIEFGSNRASSTLGPVILRRSVLISQRRVCVYWQPPWRTDHEAGLDRPWAACDHWRGLRGVPALLSDSAACRPMRCAILILLCLAYAGPAVAKAHAKPAKKIEIMTCAPPKHGCTCPNGVPGQATCCPTSSPCACSDTTPPVPFCG